MLIYDKIQFLVVDLWMKSRYIFQETYTRIARRANTVPEMLYYKIFSGRASCCIFLHYLPGILQTQVPYQAQMNHDCLLDTGPESDPLNKGISELKIQDYHITNRNPTRKVKHALIPTMNFLFRSKQ